jgi:hypothetical protein
MSVVPTWVKNLAHHSKDSGDCQHTNGNNHHQVASANPGGQLFIQYQQRCKHCPRENKAYDKDVFPAFVEHIYPQGAPLCR